MARRTGYYLIGGWNAQCDTCGGWFKNTELQKQWDGYMVCAMCWDYRHPQELIRPIRDPIPPAWTRPDKVHFLHDRTTYDTRALGTNTLGILSMG